MLVALTDLWSASLLLLWIAGAFHTAADARRRFANASARRLWAVLALLLYFLHALVAVGVGFVLALVGYFLDALFFFPGFICRKWLVVLGNQALDLLAMPEKLAAARAEFGR